MHINNVEYGYQSQSLYADVFCVVYFFGKVVAYKLYTMKILSSANVESTTAVPLRRDVVLGTCTCTRVQLEYRFQVLVLVLVLEG